ERAGEDGDGEGFDALVGEEAQRAGHAEELLRLRAFRAEDPAFAHPVERDAGGPEPRGRGRREERREERARGEARHERELERAVAQDALPESRALLEEVEEEEEERADGEGRDERARRATERGAPDEDADERGAEHPEREQRDAKRRHGRCPCGWGAPCRRRRCSRSRSRRSCPRRGALGRRRWAGPAGRRR